MNAATFSLSTVLAITTGTAATSAAEPPSASPAQQAFELRMDGKSDEAFALLERELAENARDASAWYEMARTEFYHFHFDQAANAISQAIELAPDRADYHSFAGVTAAYNAVHKYHDPQTRGEANEQMGQSLDAFAKAVELDPNDHEARIQLINMLMEAPAAQGGDRAAAKAHAEQLEKMDPVYGVEARCIVDDASDRATVERWRAVAVAHPKRADAHEGLAKALLNADDFDDAQEEIDEAMRLDPSCATLLFHLSRSRAMAGSPELARAAAEQYLDRAPGAPAPLRAFARFFVAALEKRHGDPDRAEELLAEARRIDPHCWTTMMEPPEVLFESP